MDGIPALDLWDLVIEVLHSSFNQTTKSKETVQGDLLRNKPSRKHTHSQTKTQIQHNDLEFSNVDYVSSNVKSSHSGAVLHIFEDLEHVRIFQGGKNFTQKPLRGPTMWKGMLKITLREIANWRTKRQSSFSKSQVLAWMITISRKKKLESVGEWSKVCSQIVSKCLYLARIGRLDILWSVNKLVSISQRMDRCL